MTGSLSPYISICLARFLALSMSNPLIFFSQKIKSLTNFNWFDFNHTYVFLNKLYELGDVFLDSLSFETYN